MGPQDVTTVLPLVVVSTVTVTVIVVAAGGPCVLVNVRSGGP